MVTLTRPAFIAAIGIFVQDTAGKLKDAMVSQSLDVALEQYGTDRPLILSLDIPGNNTSDFLLSVLTNIDERYVLDPLYGLRIEYPIAASGSYPAPLFRESWLFYQKPTGNGVRLLGVTPASSETLRFTYRARYVIDDSDASKTTVWAADFYAFCKLAAAEACEMLARMFTQTVSSQPQADFSSFTTKGQDYTNRAKTLQLNGPGYEGFNTGDWPFDDYFA